MESHHGPQGGKETAPRPLTRPWKRPRALLHEQQKHPVCVAPVVHSPQSRGTGLTFLGSAHFLLGPTGTLVHLHGGCKAGRAPISTTMGVLSGAPNLVGEPPASDALGWREPRACRQEGHSLSCVWGSRWRWQLLWAEPDAAFARHSSPITTHEASLTGACEGSGRRGGTLRSSPSRDP